MDFRFLIPLLVSLIALSFSIFSWWYLWISPFKLRFTAGRPLLSTLVDRRSSGLLYTAPIVPLDLANTGARGGVVEDIRIIVKTDKEKRNWILYPEYFCGEFASLSVLFEKGKTEEFHPLFIPGRQSVFRNICFRPMLKDNKIQPLTFSNNPEMPALPAEDTWTFEYYVLDNLRPEYRLVQKQEFKVTREQIRTGLDIPETSNMVDAQSQLIRKLK
jgi:hypothetical protein